MNDRDDLWARRELWRRWRGAEGLVHVTRVEHGVIVWDRAGSGVYRRRTVCAPGTIVCRGANLAAVKVDDDPSPVTCFACLTDADA